MGETLGLFATHPESIALTLESADLHFHPQCKKTKYFLNYEEAERLGTKSIPAAATVTDEKGCQYCLILKISTNRARCQHRLGQGRVLG